MFQLIENKSLEYLDSYNPQADGFTACIIDPFDEAIHGNEENYFESLVKLIGLPLVPGAYVLVRSTPETSYLTTKIFAKAGFLVKPTMIRLLNQRYEPWLIFQKEGKDYGLAERKRGKSYPLVIPVTEPTDEELAICDNQKIVPQKLLREFALMLSPDPKNSRILVPYFGLGTAVAACEAVGVDCVGFDMLEPLEDNFNYTHEIVKLLTALKI